MPPVKKNKGEIKGKCKKGVKEKKEKGKGEWKSKDRNGGRGKEGKLVVCGDKSVSLAKNNRSSKGKKLVNHLMKERKLSEDEDFLYGPLTPKPVATYFGDPLWGDDHRKVSSSRSSLSGSKWRIKDFKVKKLGIDNHGKNNDNKANKNDKNTLASFHKRSNSSPHLKPLAPKKVFHSKKI